MNRGDIYRASQRMPERGGKPALAAAKLTAFDRALAVALGLDA